MQEVSGKFRQAEFRERPHMKLIGLQEQLSKLLLIIPLESVYYLSIIRLLREIVNHSLLHRQSRM